MGLALVFTFAAVLTAMPAFAQGGGSSIGSLAESGRRQALQLTVALQNAYDADLTSGEDEGDYHATLQTGLTYLRRNRRSGVGAAIISLFRYSPDLVGVTPAYTGANLGFASGLGRRSSYRANLSAGYFPYYVIDTGVGGTDDFLQAPQFNIDNALSRREAYSYGAAAGLSHQLTRRWSLSLDYGGRYRNFLSSTEPDLAAHDAGVRLHRRLGDHASIRAGYVHHAAFYTDEAGRHSVEAHDLDVGLDYSRGLTLTRRTTLGFGSGSTIVDGEQGAQYRVLGQLYLNHTMGRRDGLNARLAYQRGLQFVEGFSVPFFTDSVSLTFEGRPGSRLRLSLVGGYSTGGVGIGGGDNSFDSYSGSARLGVTLTRLASLLGEYVYYTHRFGGGVDVPIGVSNLFRRHGARLGLSFGLPLLR